LWFLNVIPYFWASFLENFNKSIYKLIIAMDFRSFLKYGFVLVLALLVFSCKQDSITPTDNTNSELRNLTANYNSAVPREWINLYMDVEKDLPGFRPAATSRALAYIWLAAYETGLPGMPDFVSNETKTNFSGLNVPDAPTDIENYDWAVAVNTALYVCTNHFMWNAETNQKGLMKDLETNINEELVRTKNISQTVFSKSQDWGRKVAEAVIAYSQTDVEGETQSRDAFPDSYVSPTGVGKWKVTAPFTKALFPYWGKVRTFATFGEELLSPPPPVYSTNPTSQYYKDFYEVYENVKNLTPERQWRAEFWSDDIVGLTFSPPARVFQIANQMINNENSNLEFSLHLLFKLGIAENDGAVAAWGSKYIYNVERPINYIPNHIADGQNFKTILGWAIGAENITPPFPGYPSGHSTFGGLSISVLSEFFGHAYTFTDRCHQGRTEFYGTPRVYTNMTQIGEENAYSRIPLGVHPRFDCSEGLRLGKLVGQNVVDYNLRK
jgi:hypothetical protein